MVKNRLAIFIIYQTRQRASLYRTYSLFLITYSSHIISFNSLFTQIAYETDEAETTINPPVTFDLSTLNLSAGTHSITVRAKANGYADSAESEAVEYTIKETGITHSGGSQ